MFKTPILSDDKNVSSIHNFNTYPAYHIKRPIGSQNALTIQNTAGYGGAVQLTQDDAQESPRYDRPSPQHQRQLRFIHSRYDGPSDSTPQAPSHLLNVYPNQQNAPNRPWTYSSLPPAPSLKKGTTGKFGTSSSSQNNNSSSWTHSNGFQQTKVDHLLALLYKNVPLSNDEWVFILLEHNNQCFS